MGTTIITILFFAGVGIALLWVIVTVVRIVRGMAKTAQQGMVFSEKAWQWKEGETITLNDLWPAQSSFFKLFPSDQLPSIRPATILDGHAEDVSYKVFRIAFSLPGAPTVLQARFTFLAAFTGKLVVMRVDGPTIGRDAELESIEFNKQTVVQASSTKVAYAILSPDFMDWYLTCPQKPLLIFEGSVCYCTIVESSGTPFDVKEFIEQLLHHIRHSGALTSMPIQSS